MRLPRLGLLTFCFLLFTLPLLSQDEMSYSSLKTSKFGNLPVLPGCMTVAALHGDPSKGPAVLAGKLKAGCKVPWHWHTAAENLVLVSGSGKAEMKDGASHVLAPGDYVYMPGKKPHQFTCPVACAIYVMPSAAFDIHYIDKDGKEIPVEQALVSNAKAAPAKKPAKP
jgi:mannose-6-phosphate isomerase-like protein (cupin superfamily)